MWGRGQCGHPNPRGTRPVRPVPLLPRRPQQRTKITELRNPCSLVLPPERDFLFDVAGEAWGTVSSLPGPAHSSSSHLAGLTWTWSSAESFPPPGRQLTTDRRCRPAELGKVMPRGVSLGPSVLAGICLLLRAPLLPSYLPLVYPRAPSRVGSGNWSRHRRHPEGAW